MGTWGAGGFENDTALDCGAEFASTSDLMTVLTGVTCDPTQEIDADRAQQTIAAAEYVAAMMGRPADDMPDDLAKKAQSFGDAGPELRDAARNAVSVVLRESELGDLWAEEDPAAFNLAVTSLIDRLNPALPSKPRKKSRKKEVRQTCSFCNAEIDSVELVAISIRQPVDDINVLDRGFWCHLACLNAKLHPRHIVQNWKFDPKELEQDVDRILDQS